MQQQEWRSQIFKGRVKDTKRFTLALLCADVERWTIIPTIRPQSVAEHAFNVAMIADAMLEELGFGRGSMIRTDAMRWALWHDADEIFTGDIPTPMKMQVPKHVMIEANKLSGAETHLEECSSGLATSIVKLADLVESCRFLNTWGVEPSKTSISDVLKERIREKLANNLNLGDLGLLISQFIKGEDVTWWMERLNQKENENNISIDILPIMRNMTDSLSRLKTTQPTQCGRSSSLKSTRKGKSGKSGSKTSKPRSTQR